MTLLAIWLLIWFILNLVLISLGIYIKIMDKTNYTSLLERWAIKKHENRVKQRRIKFTNRVCDRFKKWHSRNSRTKMGR